MNQVSINPVPPNAVTLNLVSANRTGMQGPAAPASGLRRLCDVREVVHVGSLGTWDTVVAREELSFKDGQLAFPLPAGEETRLTPTGWATGQLCVRLGIPAPYFRKCPEILQDMQVNYWLREHRSRDNRRVDVQGQGAWLLRARGEALRAILSERYSPLDNTDLMDVLTPMLDDRLKVDWFSLEDEGLHLRIVDPKRAREVLPDDALTVGIHIANSEVGLRSVTVDALVYRLVCQNGLIRLVKGKSLLRQRHIHIQHPRLATALEAAVAAAWNEAEGFVEQMRRTTQLPVEDVEGTIGRLGERWNLSSSVQEDLLASLRREPAFVQETVYGVVNAFTNVAQRQGAEARYDLEMLAGRLAEAGVPKWAQRREEKGQSSSSPTIDSDANLNGDENGLETRSALGEPRALSVTGELTPGPGTVEVSERREGRSYARELMEVEA